MNIKNITFVVALMCAPCLEMIAQQDESMTEVELYGYDRQIVLDDWKAWEQNPSPANAYVGEFMTQYQVPQTPVGDLNLHTTWLWWISNNKAEILEYIEMKEESESE